MRKRLIGLGAALALGWAMPATAGPARGAVLSYEVYAGGIKALSFDVGLGFGETQYSAELLGRTQGMIDWMVGWLAHVRTEGRREDGAYIPEAHRNDSTFRSDKRTLSMQFVPGGDVEVSAQPSVIEDNREEVPLALRRGTVDPLTATLQVSRRLEQKLSCPAAVPVFDGRRRFDLAFTDLGNETLAPTRYGMFAGQARLCSFQIKQVAGYSKRPNSRWVSPEDRDRVHKMWAGKVLPGLAPVPVRIEAEAAFGNVVVHLVRAEITPGRPTLAQAAVPVPAAASSPLPATAQ